MCPKICVIIMLKYPSPGMVKTRLGQELGQECAAGLYRSFVACELEVLQSLQVPVLLSCDPGFAILKYREWLGPEFNYLLQTGDDLGVRMQSSFEQAFELGFTQAVLVGSDLPHLPAAYIQLALDRLQDHDVILGPAQDGGYYLLGMNSQGFQPCIFEGIPWSTSQVFNLTLKKLEEYQVKAFFLPSLRDIDTLQDLQEMLAAQGFPVEPHQVLIESARKYLLHQLPLAGGSAACSTAVTMVTQDYPPGT
ncbi:MAG: TIGR04282 family arsenosugar biosynthesis glycosyltransferase [Thermodesulfobacteriota bacterium]